MLRRVWNTIKSLLQGPAAVQGGSIKVPSKTRLRPLKVHPLMQGSKTQAREVRMRRNSQWRRRRHTLAALGGSVRSSV